MAKKKPSWTQALIIGIVLGAASQQIPEIRKCTQRLCIYLSKNMENYITPDQLQDILLKKRLKR